MFWLTLHFTKQNVFIQCQCYLDPNMLGLWMHVGGVDCVKNYLRKHSFLRDCTIRNSEVVLVLGAEPDPHQVLLIVQPIIPWIDSCLKMCRLNQIPLTIRVKFIITIIIKIVKTRTTIVVIRYHLSNTIYPIPFIKYHLSNTFFQIPFIK